MKNFRINERISASRVLLILPSGENKGEMSKFAAIDLARENGLDLVEVSDGIIPVCKLMNYGKIQYDAKKADKHKNHTPVMKEIQIHYLTGEHDLEIKRRKAMEFLEKGHKVFFSMGLKGRERYVVGNAAKERFKLLVSTFFSAFKTTDISESPKGYNVTVAPTRVAVSTSEV